MLAGLETQFGLLGGGNMLRVVRVRQALGEHALGLWSSGLKTTVLAMILSSIEYGKLERLKN